MKRNVILAVVSFLGLIIVACNPVISKSTATIQSVITGFHAITSTPTVPLLHAFTWTSTPTHSQTPYLSVTPTVATTPMTVVPQLEPGSLIDLTWLDMLDAKNGWAIGGSHAGGNSSHVLRTVDGGASWIEVTPPVETKSIPDVVHFGFVGFAYDINTAWVTYAAGVSGRTPVNPIVWRTTDGGQTWRASPPFETDPESFISVYILTFSTRNDGWMVTYDGAGLGTEYVNLYRSTDGGMNWQKIHEGNDATSFQTCYVDHVVFADKLRGWYTGGCSAAPLTASMGYTIDGGISWHDIDLATSVGNPDLFPMDWRQCGLSNPFVQQPKVVIGFSCRNDDGSAFAYNSLLIFNVDGTGWTYRAYPGGDISSLDGNKIWAFGWINNRFDISRTEDAGKSWRKIATVDWGGKLNFVSSTLGWALAKDDSEDIAKYWLYQTHDGGESWGLVNPVAAASGA